MKIYFITLIFCSALSGCGSSRPTDSFILETVAENVAAAGGSPEQVALIKKSTVENVLCSEGKTVKCSFEINKVKQVANFSKTGDGLWVSAKVR